MIVHQKPTQKAAPPFEPSMTRGRSESRKRSVSGRSQTGRILRQPCRYYLQGSCTRTSCENWYPPECQFCKTESGCNARDKYLFPHYKVEEQPNKKPKRELSKRKQRRQGCGSYCENCTSIGFCLARLRAVRTSEQNKVSEKPEAEVLGSIRRVRFTQSTLRQASIRENKGTSLEKIQVESSHRRSTHAVKFEDRSQEETERQERCARGDAWKLAENIYKLKETEKATFYSATDEWSLPVASTIKPEEREFVVISGASMRMVSGKDLNSAELATVRISKNPTTVMTVNGEVQT